MKKLIFALALIGFLPVAQAAELNEIENSRLAAAERVERIMPVENLAASMIENQARSILPLNHLVLSNFVKSRIDWRMVKEKNVENLASRFTTGELDNIAGENMTVTSLRSGMINPVLLSETKAILGSEINKATREFELAQSLRVGGFNLANQSFLEHQAQRGIYYYSAYTPAYAPVAYTAQMMLPNHNLMYLSNAAY